MIDNHRMAGLGRAFKGDGGPALCHGQGTRDTVQNLKAKYTNLSWGPGRTSGASESPAGGSTPSSPWGSAPLVMRAW